MTKAAEAYTRHLQPGQKFHRLTAVEPAGHQVSGGSRCALWRFRCDCGNEVVTLAKTVKSGLRRSCGCLRREARKPLGIGEKFARLTAVEPAGYESHRSSRRKALWRFRCDCGNEIVARVESVRSGNTKSCGCHKREATAATGHANAKHGLEGTRIYRIWRAMLGRCENPSHSRFE